MEETSSATSSSSSSSSASSSSTSSSEDLSHEEPNEDLGHIKKLIGEMKNHFNSKPHSQKNGVSEQEAESNEEPIKNEDTETNEDTEDVNDETGMNDEAELNDETGMNEETEMNETEMNDETETNDEVEKVESEDQQADQRIIMCIRKQNKRRSAKVTDNHANNNAGSPKRSMRRRSKDCTESVLQSAIARKEKSYNEYSKPQRPTRQLKATQKILDNIACAAALREDKKVSNKNKRKDGGVELSPPTVKKQCMIVKQGKSLESKVKTRRSGRLSSQVIAKDEELFETKLEENLENIKDIIVEEKKKTVTNEDNIENDETDDYVVESSVTQQLIASRLCVCAVQTQYYPLNEANNNVYCNALDSISGRLIGCNNKVSQEVPMQRPSMRIPYMVLCNIHRKRLMDHHCCPSCGLFCTQGDFFECPSRHYFHKHCQLFVGDLECCPHCGDQGRKYSVKITMKTDSKLLMKDLEQRVVAIVDAGGINKDYPVKLEPQYDEEKGLKVGRMVKERSPPIMNIEDLKDIVKGNEMSEQNTNEEECQYEIEDLFKEIQSGNYGQVASILAEGNVDLETFVDFDDAESGTVMHYAAKHGLLTVMHMLKIAQMDLNVVDVENNTPLMVAVVHWQNETVKYLCKAGVCVNTKGTDGMTSLHLGAKFGNLEAVKELLLAATHIKGYVNFVDDGGWSPLVWACEHGHLDVVKYLLTEGADVHIADVEGNVALHWAAFNGTSSILELILNFGATIDVTNIHGDTPLHLAARHDNYNSVLVLLARGAQIDIENDSKETPITCCPKESQSHQAMAINKELCSLIKVKQCKK